jgi:transcriptional regulator with XRE-family HTH domain
MIKDMRTKAGMSAKELGKATGLSESYILDVEYGRKVLNDDMVKKISKVLRYEFMEQVTDSYAAADSNDASSKLKPRPLTRNEPQKIQEVWNDAFESVLKTLPIYEYDLNKVTGTRQLPVISNKIEGLPKDKVFFLKICDNDLNGFRILKDDIALACHTSEIRGSGFYLIEHDGQKVLRQVKKLDKDRLLLINNAASLRADTVSAKEIKILAQLLKLEIDLTLS